MAKDLFYTAIDLGTTKVCTIIASIRPEGGLLVHGVGIEPSRGMHNGRVVDIGKAQDAVRLSLHRAQQDLGKRVSWAYVGVTGDHITCMNAKSSIKRLPNGSGVSKGDLVELTEAARPQVPAGKELVHQISMGFIVDGLRGVRSPEGLAAQAIELESLSIIGDVGPLSSVINTVKGCKVTVRSLVLQPLAAAEAVLTEDEREMGTVLVDIGGGTSDLIIYRGGSPWYSSVLPVGGFQLTNDLSVALGGAPYEMAEDLKVRFSHALPGAIEADEEVAVPPFETQEGRNISRRNLCQPLHERMVETLELISLKVRQSGLREFPPGGLVLTGGTAEMPGLQELARRVMSAPVRIAFPRGVPGLPSSLRKPAYSTGVGVLLWGMKHHGEMRSYQAEGKSPWSYAGLLRRLINSARRR